MVGGRAKSVWWVKLTDQGVVITAVSVALPFVLDTDSLIYSIKESDCFGGPRGEFHYILQENTSAFSACFLQNLTASIRHSLLSTLLALNPRLCLGYVNDS